MVAEARTWVDVESAVREWARDAVVGANRRVFFAPTASTEPQIALFRVAGPDDRCLIQFDAWAPNKAQAASLAAELATAADALGRYTHGDVLLHGARVEGVRWQPDEESGAARYVVEATITATATQ